MTTAKALAEFLRAQVTLAGCCRALLPLVEMAKDGNPEAHRLAFESLKWIIEERKR